ncbi:MAG: DUF6179 domain-containing protein [Vallitalea sp.]|jgi:hypothetical protein|nr:DUF6179 domain-containing protein [Vallitalea sp.]
MDTLSLVNQGVKKGLISQQSIDNFQVDLLNILKKLIDKYTFGESSSVKIETAENLLLSVHYCIDAYLDSIEYNDAIEMIEKLGLNEIYKRGKDEIKNCLETCKLLYENVKNNMFNIELQAYNDTINSISDFFIHYNYLFAAHDTMGCSIDYPLSLDEMKLQGVYYIKEYLEKLTLETEFCTNFEIEDIIELLENYGAVYKLDYRELLINIFEIVYNNYIFALMVGNKKKNLHITNYQYNFLINLLNELSLEKVIYLVNENVKKLIIELRITQKNLIDYIEGYKHKFLEVLISNIKNGDLKYMIITDQRQDVADIHLLDIDNRMNDEEFKTLVDKIMECKQFNEKLQIISLEVNCIVDFIDILKSDCLIGENEFNMIFKTLSNMELAILGKIVFNEYLKFGHKELLHVHLEDDEEEWKLYFNRYINDLDTKTIRDIERLIEACNISI